MSDTLKRIQENGATCISSYEEWQNDKKSSDKREALQDSLHEMRKSMARIEIEIATSDRDASSVKKLPIPSHRSHSKSHDGGTDSILPDREEQNNGGGKVVKKTLGRRTRTRKPSEG